MSVCWKPGWCECPECGPLVEVCSCGWSDEEHDPSEHRPASHAPSTPTIKPPPDPRTETLLQAVDVLRVDADGVALPLTSPLLRAVADWLEMTADQIDQASHEFSTVPHPRGHDRRAMKVALAALGELTT